METDHPTEHERAHCSADLRHFLSESRGLREQANGDPVLCRRRLRLREWQAARLARTHADLLASPRFGQAATFFLNDLYGPKDFSERDAEVERILPLMVTMLPVSGLRTVLLAVEVDALSERLDGAMVQVLGRRLEGRTPLDEATYADAYRQLGRRDERERQVTLIRATGEALDALAHKAFARAALKMMHGPAHLAGLGALHDFLERGFEAFRSMGDAETFLDAVVQRESAILRALFSGRSDPFDVTL